MTEIAWTHHARERSRERRITPATVERIARAPFVTKPTRDGATAHIDRALHDDRWAFCVVVVAPEADDRLKVITAYWRDSGSTRH